MIDLTAPAPNFIRPRGQPLAPWAPAARSILEDGMWCVLEVCADPAAQRWEPALILCTEDDSRVSGELAKWIADFPALDVRICGYTRKTLDRVDDSPTALCYVAGPAPLS